MNKQTIPITQENPECLLPSTELLGHGVVLPFSAPCTRGILVHHAWLLSPNVVFEIRLYCHTRIYHSICYTSFSYANLLEFNFHSYYWEPFWFLWVVLLLLFHFTKWFYVYSGISFEYIPTVEFLGDRECVCSIYPILTHRCMNCFYSYEYIWKFEIYENLGSPSSATCGFHQFNNPDRYVVVITLKFQLAFLWGLYEPGIFSCYWSLE